MWQHFQFSSVASNSLRPHELQHAKASLTITNSRSLLKFMPIESVMPSSHLILSSPSPPAPNPSQHQGLFQWVNSSHEVAIRSIGVSASASVLPMNTQDCSPLGWAGWISLQPKGLSRVFSSTIVQKHQFFGTQLSSQPNSHIHTWPLEKP